MKKGLGKVLVTSVLSIILVTASAMMAKAGIGCYAFDSTGHHSMRYVSETRRQAVMVEPDRQHPNQHKFEVSVRVNEACSYCGKPGSYETVKIEYR